MDENLNKTTLHIDNQEVSKEELMHTFEILHKKGLINKGELQRAIMLTNQRHKPMRIIDESNMQTNN